MTATNLKPYVERAQVVVVVDEDPDTSWLEQGEWTDRLEAYSRGDFYFVGVYAEARIRFQTPQGGWTQGAYVRTPGVWGIESDSDESYLAEVGNEEQGELAEMLEALNVTLSSDPLPISYRT